MLLRLAVAVALAAGVWGAAGGLAHAQDSGCRTERVSGPSRTVLRCAGGLVLDIEAAAQAGLQVDGRGPVEMTLSDGGVLVNARPGTRFQIRTPHAIASVRGTQFIVDVSEEQTSLFVIEGRVNLKRRFLPENVTLGPGEGVDCSRTEPLTVVEWGEPRVDALLARFGR